MLRSSTNFKLTAFGSEEPETGLYLEKRGHVFLVQNGLKHTIKQLKFQLTGISSLLYCTLFRKTVIEERNQKI